MSTTKTLELVFRNQGGKDVTIGLADPKEGVKLTEAQTVAQSIISKNIFISKGGDLVQYVDARVHTKEAVSLV